MRRVDVAHLVTGAGTVEAAGTEGGDGAEMLEFIESIILLHELRELVGREKLFHPSLQWFRRNELHRQSDIGIDGRHPILDISLDLGHTDTNFLLEKFSHKTYSSRTEVVNIIFHRARSIVEVNDVGDDRDYVGERESAAFDLFGGLLDAEAIIKSETPDAR